MQCTYRGSNRDRDSCTDASKQALNIQQCYRIVAIKVEYNLTSCMPPITSLQNARCFGEPTVSCRRAEQKNLGKSCPKDSIGNFQGWMEFNAIESIISLAFINTQR